MTDDTPDKINYITSKYAIIQDNYTTNIISRSMNFLYKK